MHDLKPYDVMYPNGTRRVYTEDRIDAQERAQERWGTPPVDVLPARRQQ